MDVPGLNPLVLVVDDHPVNRMVMCRQLNTLGYVTEEAEDGAQALRQWSTGRFALVLTDCNMPEMSGYDLSRQIRAAETTRGGRRTPIIACSADVSPGVRERCLDAGMDEYISKPTELVSMAKVMGRWLPPSRQSAGTSTSVDRDDPENPPPPQTPLSASALQAIAKGDPVATRQVLEHFRRVNDADVTGLLRAVEGGDIAAVTHFAHRIKGSCGFIGATELASMSDMLEQAGRAEDVPTIYGLIKEFRSELERLNVYLDAVRAHPIP